MLRSAAIGVVGTTLMSMAASAAVRDSRVPTIAPSMIVAKSGNARVTLAWTPVSGAIGYRIFRSANGRWEPEPVASTSATTHTSANLENGTRYSFTVAAFNKEGIGPLSLAVTAIPLAAPEEITATPADERIILRWSPSTGATSYAIYRRMTTEPEFYEHAVGVVTPEFVDTGLTNGRRYFYQVRAVSGAWESDRSERVSAVAARPQ